MIPSQYRSITGNVLCFSLEWLSEFVRRSLNSLHVTQQDSVIHLKKKHKNVQSYLERKETVQFSTMQTRHTNFGVKYSRNRLYATMWKCCYMSFQLITKCQTHDNALSLLHTGVKSVQNNSWGPHALKWNDVKCLPDSWCSFHRFFYNNREHDPLDIRHFLSLTDEENTGRWVSAYPQQQDGNMMMLLMLIIRLHLNYSPYKMFPASLSFF